MAVNNFNPIVPFYDFLAGLIFGKILIQSQEMCSAVIKSTDNVLILGGGTGEILKLIPECKEITFLEKSENMLRKARKKKIKSRSFFIEADFFNYPFEEKYDVIICPFFLDCFDREHLHWVIEKCKKLLTLDGYLFVSDFQSMRNNKNLLRLMHFFFRITVKLQSSGLKDIHKVVISKGFEVVEERFFYHHWIFSRLYV